MSLDIYFEEVKPVEVHEQYITHNLHSMAVKLGLDCLWNPDECGIKCAGDLINPIAGAVIQLQTNPEHYKHLNASNGWGTADQFLPWLERLLRAAKEYPMAQVRVSK